MFGVEGDAELIGRKAMLFSRNRKELVALKPI